jgi:hypothetical protein
LAEQQDSGDAAATSYSTCGRREAEGRTVIAAMRVHYTWLDGQELTLPCCNLFGTRAGQVDDYRVYMDINPVFAA